MKLEKSILDPRNNFSFLTKEELTHQIDEKPHLKNLLQFDSEFLIGALPGISHVPVSHVPFGEFLIFPENEQYKSSAVVSLLPSAIEVDIDEYIISKECIQSQGYVNYYVDDGVDIQYRALTNSFMFMAEQSVVDISKDINSQVLNERLITLYEKIKDLVPNYYAVNLDGILE